MTPGIYVFFSFLMTFKYSVMDSTVNQSTYPATSPVLTSFFYNLGTQIIKFHKAVCKVSVGGL